MGEDSAIPTKNIPPKVQKLLKDKFTDTKH